MDIYEINRREAARILLESSRWFKPGTFRPKPGTVPPPQPDDPPPTGYQLELCVMEVSDAALLDFYLFKSRCLFADNHHEYARPADFAAQTDLLLCAHHRSLQAIRGNVWAGGGEIDPQALRAAQRRAGCGSSAEIRRVVLGPHEQFWVPMGVERMVRSGGPGLDSRLTISD